MCPNPTLSPFVTDESIRDSFRAAMRRLASTIAIITAGTEQDSWRGMAATSVVSVSADPPTVLVAVHRDSGIMSALGPGALLCVNLLSLKHHALVPAFSGEVRGVQRFQHGIWRASTEGLPVLDDAAASLTCITREIVTAATHRLFIAEVTSVTVSPEFDPLLWGDGSLAKAVLIARPVEHDG